MKKYIKNASDDKNQTNRNKTSSRIIKNNKTKKIMGLAITLLIIAAIAMIGARHYSKSHASGTAAFVVSPTTGTFKTGQIFTVTVSENSGTDQVNAVQMNLSYNSTQLQFNNVTSGSSAASPFTLCGQSSGGAGIVNVACAYPSGATSYVTGNNVVATISFTMLASTGSTLVSIANGSDIVLLSGQVNDWNNVLTSGTYTVALPPIVSITSPTALAHVHGAVNITANASDQSGTGISKVSFLNISTILGTSITSPYSYTWNTLSGSVPNSKSYTLTAEAYDNANDVTVSPGVSVCINNGDVNNDGVVNITDLSIMGQNWGLAGATYAQGNVASQSAVNIVDLSVMAANWAFSCV